MNDALSKLTDAKAISEATPKEISTLTASVVDATKTTDETIDELYQLEHALDKFGEKNKIYKMMRSSLRTQMQDIASEL